MIVFHATTYKKLRRMLKSGAIRPPVRGWLDIQEAVRFLLQTRRHLILVLDFPEEWVRKLEGHKGKAVYIDRPYFLATRNLEFGEIEARDPKNPKIKVPLYLFL